MHCGLASGWRYIHSDITKCLYLLPSSFHKLGTSQSPDVPLFVPARCVSKLKGESLPVKTLRLSLVLAFVLLPITAFAQVPWTGSAGSFTVDEDSSLFYRYDTGQLSYDTGATAPLIARMNVTDTTGTGYPGWTTMEIQGYDPSNKSLITVKLFRLTAGTATNIATCTSVDSPVVQTTTCPLLNAVDFNSGYIYEVQVEVTRTTNNVSPFMSAVRLY
jgi:hypothetical protein